LTLLHNTIYFKEDFDNVQHVLPYQSTGFQSSFAPEVRGSVKFLRRFFFRPQVIYTSILSNDDDVLRIPQLFVNAQFAYENSLVRNHIQIHAGVDFHWHSDYRALGYDPVIQTFYVQNTAVTKSFPLVDIFFVGKMGRTRYFFKYHNLVQTLTGYGYMPTPNYPGTRGMIDFGFEFILFD